MFCSALSANRRVSAKSTCSRPGPVNKLRPAFPHVPGAGTVNAAGLIHRSGDCPEDGFKETPGTRFGRCTLPLVELLPLLPSGTAVRLRVTIIVSGRPLLAWTRPDACQPPKRCPPTPFDSKC